MPPAIRGAIIAVGLVVLSAAAAAQPPAPGGLFRIFLRDGSALPAYGDVAVVADRAVFTLAVGEAPNYRFQLMSLPTTEIDLEKTASYSRSVRASYYAATRGEADYSAMTQEVAAALDYLTQVADPKERLRLAEQARTRLMDWSRENYGYRAKDIEALAGLFDEVIAELRAAAGESSFTLDLSAGSATAPLEPLLEPPSLRQSIEAALAAARAADVPEERLGVLRTALVSLDGHEDVADLRDTVSGELKVEEAVGESYRLLGEDLLGRAEAAATAGDISAFARIRADLSDRDAALGRRRPAEVAALRKALDGWLDKTVERRLTLDRYALARAKIVDYEKAVRPALSGIDGLRSVLEYLRDQKYFNFQRLETSIARFARYLDLVQQVTPPEEMTDVHATLISALHMAQQACARRRLYVVTSTESFNAEAGAAAAGALLLADEVRKEILARLRVSASR
ncbi:MAG: hypothetical protein R2752_10755 [Vicinamibacterales bacterium]